MHKTRVEAVDLAAGIVSGLGDYDHRVMVAPPFTALDSVRAAVSGSKVALGAQNMAAELEGAHTGEVSVRMLKDVGVEVVILGHSERRHVYGEDDALINTKVRLALSEGMDVILCVGETLSEREAGNVRQVVDTQVEAGLAGVNAEQLGSVVIAYEPVWAIGTGKTAKPEDADEVHGMIRKKLSSLYSEDAAANMVIQYGGSVKPANVKELMAKENIDGALVGGASLEADSFLAILHYETQ
jgi:triosephosphate isomerase